MPPPAALAAGALLLLLAGCGARQAAWDGRRGYDGRGDYGYDLAARPAPGLRGHAPPGPPHDPWGPYIREAAARFGTPEAWIREVMRQESGGRPEATSPAGAMGLMQVMPRTFATLRMRHGLGPDPYAPRDNILAGAAYLQEMHDRYGAPGFLAAYNAGPDRVDLVLAGATVLPDETVGYLASLAPRLGMAALLEGPFATGPGRPAAWGGSLAHSGGGAVALDGIAAARMPGEEDLSGRAFDGGGLVTPEAPTGVLTPAF